MLECASGILSVDVCGVSLGYIGLWTLGGALGGFYLVSGYGLAVGMATGFAGAIMGFALGLFTLPIMAALVALAMITLCLATFLGACYGLFLIVEFSQA